MIFVLSAVSSGAKCDTILSQSSTTAMGPLTTCKHGENKGNQHLHHQLTLPTAHKGFLKRLVLGRKREVGTQGFCFTLISSIKDVPSSFSNGDKTGNEGNLLVFIKIH